MSGFIMERGIDMAKHKPTKTPLNRQDQLATTQAIIVSRPGIMQESLRAVLATAPQIEIIKSVGDGLSALDVVREQPPHLLVIDSNLLEDEIVALLRHVKQESPTVCCLVLTESIRQEEWALTRGADAVWPRYRPPRELNELLEQICPCL